MIDIFYDVVLQLYLFTLGTLVWAEMALIKKVTEKKVMFKSILSKVSHSMHKRMKCQKIRERGMSHALIKFIFGAYGFVNYWRILQSSAFADKRS